MRSAFRSVRQARKVAAFAPVTVVAVIPQNLCGNYTAINFSAITGTAYSETPDLDPVEISYGSGLRHNSVITCLTT